MDSKEHPTRQICDSELDSSLVNCAKDGDLQAFEALLNRHEGRIYSLALRILRHEQDAEDVTQETFVSALENLNGFRGESAFATWLVRIATHAALKVIRKRRRLDTVPFEQVTDSTNDSEPIPHPEYIADWRQSPEELVRNSETRRLLDQALQALDEKHRLVFVLRDIEGLSVRETAEALELSDTRAFSR